MYAAFEDKARLHLKAFEQYQCGSVAGHAHERENLRKCGCMDVGLASGFGTTE
jgi:hypothetical protein